MSDMSSLNRESKKRQLKSRVITPNSSPPPRVQAEDGDSEEIVRKATRKVRRRRFLLSMTAALLVAGAGVGYYQYQSRPQYMEYQVTWEHNVERSESSFAGYMNFGNNVLKYSKDGAAYTDNQGKDIWIQSYEMKSPVAVVNGDYAAIADQQGNTIQICDKSGNLGTATTLLPITKVAVSAHGVAAAILEDSRAGYITFFRKDGTPLDIMVKSTLEKDGYPIDLSLSPDGTQLMVSYVYLSNGTAKGQVVFYNFSEIGKNVPGRVVGGYKDIYDNSLVARVRFLTETYSCAFADSSLTFFSSKNVMSPEMIKQIPVEEEIRSVCYSDDYAGIVVETASGEHPYRIDIYKNNGDKQFSREFNLQFTHADIDGDYVLLYNEGSCEVYNMQGVLKFKGEFDFTVSKITKGRLPGTFIVTGPQTMKEIKLGG